MNKEKFDYIIKFLKQGYTIDVAKKVTNKKICF